MDDTMTTSKQSNPRTTTVIKRSIVSFLLGTSLALPMAAQSAVFSIVVLTDAQFYAELHPEILEAQIDWIVANQEEENIIYMAQTGDLKDDQFCDNKTLVNIGTGAGRTEWQIADEAYEDLDTADIPYAVLPGNHDFDPVPDGFGFGGMTCPPAAGQSGTPQRPLSEFNTRFGPGRFAGESFYGDPLMNRPGNRLTDSNEDNFTLFESNGIKFISINLAYRPAPNPTPPNMSVNLLRDNPELAWADQRLKDYPDRLGIVTSHNFMNTNENDFNGNPKPPLTDYGQAVYDALSGNRNLFMMLAGHWWGENWLSATTGRPTGAGPVQVLMGNYQGHIFPDDGDPNTPPNTPNPALIDFSMLPSQKGGLGARDAGYMRIMRFDTNTRRVNIETFIPPVVPIKNRTGTIVSTFTANSGADMGLTTASNLSFSFDNYVPLPFVRTGSLANDQFLRFLGGPPIAAAEINSRCADANGCQMTLTSQLGTAAPTVFGPITFRYNTSTNTWSGGAATAPTGVNGSDGTRVILGSSARPGCYFSDWDSSTSSGIPDRNLNWSVIIGNPTSTRLTCELTIVD
jgi:predicted outer membrane repeat protein